MFASEKFLSLCMLVTWLASALMAGAATDLVGRNGQFTVKDTDGNVETVDTKQLEVQSELLPSVPRAVIGDAPSDQPGDSAKAGEKLPAKELRTVPAAKPATSTEETAEEKATRAADVEVLRAMRKQGGAYFYTEDNKPVSFEEIDRRIETGKVEGLKAVGLHLQEWKPETKSKKTVSSTSAPATAPATETPPKEKKKY